MFSRLVSLKWVSSESATPVDAGQAAPLVGLLLGVAVLTALVLAQLGVRATDQARAQTAADAAALAAALDGPEAAAALALANGALLTGVSEASGRVVVDVGLGEGSATAAAELVVDSEHLGLAAPLITAIAEAERLLGERVPVVSGYRTRAEQQTLWDARGSNPYPVAVPGTSAHERGLAIDVPSGFVAALKGVAGSVGLCQPLPVADPVHFEVCRTTATR